MKNDIIFLEFNGIPGSGKTTLANRLIAEMRDEPYSVESYHQIIKKPTRKNLKNLLLYLFKIKPSSYKVGYYAWRHLIANKKLSHENWLRVISIVVLFDLYQKKSLDNQGEVILVDQGIMQQIISMLYESELIVDKYVKKIISFTKKRNLGIVIINVDLNISDSFKRLSQRQGNISRIQKLNKEKAIITLEVQQKNFIKIRKIITDYEFQSIDIDSQARIDDNLLLLKNYIIMNKNRLARNSRGLLSTEGLLMKNEIMVSVSCITYNHENYIGQALESFVMQKTRFNYELLIHDDASTDKTAEIIRFYQEKYPDLIKPIFQQENLYSKGIDVDDLNTERARGKYIALCEGDDYWTDPLKLQKQVDYMEAHPECSLCVHAAYIVNVIGKRIKPVRPHIGNKVFSVDEVIEGGGGLFATNSMMYPRSLDLNKPEFYKNAPVTDYPLAIYLALNGNVYYIDEYMAAYRKGVSGSWTTTEQSSLEKIIIHVKNTEIMLDQLNQYTKHEYSQAINNKKDINQFKIHIAKEQYQVLKEDKYKLILKKLGKKEKTKILIKRYFPRTVKIYKGLRKKYKL